MFSIYITLIFLVNILFRVTVSSNHFHSKWSAAISVALDSYHISSELVIVVVGGENLTGTVIKTTTFPTASGESLSGNLQSSKMSERKFHPKMLEDREEVSVEEMIIDFHDIAGGVMILRVELLLDPSIVEDTPRTSSGRVTAPVFFLLQHEKHPKEVLQPVMAKLSLLESWSPRAPHLLALRDGDEKNEEMVAEILGELWQRKVSRAAVLQKGPEDFLLRWWVPQGQGKDCQGPSTKGLAVKKLSPNAARRALPVRRPYNYFSGCIFKCSTITWLPYSIEDEQGFVVDGLDFRILDAIREIMNFTTIYSLSHETYLEAGNEVSNGSSHFTMGGFALMEVFYPAMDTTVSYWRERVEWFVPIGLPIPRWLSVTRVFSGFLWLGVLLSCILVSGAFTILRIRYQPTKEKRLRPYDSVRMLLGICTQEPVTTIGSWIFAVWLLSSLVINSAYQSGLIGFIANPGNYPSISTVEELAERKLKILTHIEYKDVLEGFDDQVYKIITSNTVPCEDMIVCIDQVSKSQEYALPTDVSFIAYGYEGEGRRKIKLLADIVSYSIQTFIEKGSPLLEWFDFYITGMVEGNLNGKWYDELTGSRGPLGSQGNSQRKTNAVTVTVEHLQGAFLILVAGLVVSCAVFVKEIVHLPRCRKCF